MPAAFGMESCIWIHLDGSLSGATFLNIRIVPLITDNNPIFIRRTLFHVRDAYRPCALGIDIPLFCQRPGLFVYSEYTDGISTGIHDQ